MILRTRDIACVELVEVITSYLENTMSRRDRRRFDRHIAACDGCTAFLEQMRTTIELTGTLTEESIPPAARAELLAVFRAWKEEMA